ncbi:Limbic system-associated membrane protein [Anas platyrhynchos]|uniref:Limbic system-associated membrane protein n=1 Tax=Anas platyrhynchos TaxID=8839 RepID=R0KZK2_ANAPL|nr:Limbic system-associated membrane protein [Anas platyrhynchos]
MGRQKRLVLAGELPAVPPVAWVLLAAGGREFEGEEEYLEILGITREQSGKYECKAANEVASADVKQVRVTVNYPPTITESKSNEAATGRQALLRCEASAVPTPDFEWYRDDTRINSANGLEIKSTGSQSLLMVANVTEEHYGNYTCVAANKLGVTNASLYLYNELKSTTETKYKMKFNNSQPIPEDKTGDNRAVLHLLMQSCWLNCLNYGRLPPQQEPCRILSSLHPRRPPLGPECDQRIIAGCRCILPNRMPVSSDLSTILTERVLPTLPNPFPAQFQTGSTTYQLQDKWCKQPSLEQHNLLSVTLRNAISGIVFRPRRRMAGLRPAACRPARGKPRAQSRSGTYSSASIPLLAVPAPRGAGGPHELLLVSPGAVSIPLLLVGIAQRTHRDERSDKQGKHKPLFPFSPSALQQSGDGSGPPLYSALPLEPMGTGKQLSSSRTLSQLCSEPPDQQPLSSRCLARCSSPAGPTEEDGVQAAPASPQNLCVVVRLLPCSRGAEGGLVRMLWGGIRAGQLPVPRGTHTAHPHASASSSLGAAPGRDMEPMDGDEELGEADSSPKSRRLLPVVATRTHTPQAPLPPAAQAPGHAAGPTLLLFLTETGSRRMQHPHPSAGCQSEEKEQRSGPLVAEQIPEHTSFSLPTAAQITGSPPARMCGLGLLIMSTAWQRGEQLSSIKAVLFSRIQVLMQGEARQTLGPWRQFLPLMGPEERGFQRIQRGSDKLESLINGLPAVGCSMMEIIHTLLSQMKTTLRISRWSFLADAMVARAVGFIRYQRRQSVDATKQAKFMRMICGIDGVGVEGLRLGFLYAFPRLNLDEVKYQELAYSC